MQSHGRAAAPSGRRHSTQQNRSPKSSLYLIRASDIFEMSSPCAVNWVNRQALLGSPNISCSVRVFPVAGKAGTRDAGTHLLKVGSLFGAGGGFFVYRHKPRQSIPQGNARQSSRPEDGKRSSCRVGAAALAGVKGLQTRLHEGRLEPRGGDGVYDLGTVLGAVGLDGHAQLDGCIAVRAHELVVLKLDDVAVLPGDHGGDAHEHARAMGRDTRR